MIKAEEIKKGYWFYDVVLEKPVQAKEDAQKELAGNRRYDALPITHELLIKFGFTSSKLPRMTIYDKKGFRIYRRNLSEKFQLQEFGELRRELKFIHEVQKKYREEVE